MKCKIAHIPFDLPKKWGLSNEKWNPWIVVKGLNSFFLDDVVVLDRFLCVLEFNNANTEKYLLCVFVSLFHVLVLLSVSAALLLNVYTVTVFFLVCFCFNKIDDLKSNFSFNRRISIVSTQMFDVPKGIDPISTLFAVLHWSEIIFFIWWLTLFKQINCQIKQLIAFS